MFIMFNYVIFDKVEINRLANLTLKISFYDDRRWNTVDHFEILYPLSHNEILKNEYHDMLYLFRSIEGNQYEGYS